MASRRSNRDTARRNRLVLAAVVVVMLLAIWVMLVVAVGRGADETSSSIPEETTQQNSAGEDNSPGAGNPGEQASKSQSSEPTGSEGIAGGLSDPRGGGAPEGEVPIEDAEGRTNGQRNLMAAFVSEAYGYSGSSEKEYRERFEARIDPETYYASPGGSALEEYAALIREQGSAENAAVMKEYRILSGPQVETEVPASEVETFAPPEVVSEEQLSKATLGTATYAVGDRYGDPAREGEDPGEVYGNVRHYSQQFLIVADPQSGVRILAGSGLREVEDPDADAPARDAPKVGEPSGPGGDGHGRHGH